MKALALLVVMLCGAVSAQERTQFAPQPTGPVQMVPVQMYAPYQLMQVGPPQYQPVQPRRRPRGVWGIWPIPVPLGYY